MDATESSPQQGGDSTEVSGIEGLDNSADYSKLQAIDEYHKLPAVVRRRVHALKRLQYETLKVDAEFYKELFTLEAKYDLQHQKIFETRMQIINGDKEPNDEECEWPSDEEIEEVDQLADKVKEKVTVNPDNEALENKTDAIKGIPDFWLKVMRNVALLDEMIKPHDVEILQSLKDLKCVLNTGDEPGFTLEFHFGPNKYFTDSILTKRYYFNYEISEDDPFDFEGPEIVKTKGCAINWLPNKNVTVKLIKKVQKRKGGGAKRTITKKVQEDSFFNFFQPPTQSDSDDLDEDVEVLLEADFKIGQFIRESLIPRAVLYFTGEIVDSDFEDDDDEDDEEDEDDEDEADEDEGDEPHHHQRHRHNHRNHKRTPNIQADGEHPECRTQ